MATLAATGTVGTAVANHNEESFARALQQTAQANGRAAAREAVTELVASALVVPVISSMQEQPFAEPPFAPTAVEKRFAPLLSRHLADRIVGSANFPLVDVIMDRLLGPESTNNEAKPEAEHVRS